MRIRFFLTFFLCIALVTVGILPAASYAKAPEDDAQGKTIRVGWYESTFNVTDAAGRRSGYAYDYQQKIAAYTGWNYEYVNGSWSELMQKLENGEIDMMSDVSYTEERTEKMLFPSFPMGTEEYYIFIAPDNQTITAEDLSTFNGKKIGVNKGSIQKEYYLDWAKRHGVKAELIDLTCSEDESLQRLESGALDAYITPDAVSDPERSVPVCKVGSSDFYFALARDREDLLPELNEALNQIQDENRYYHQQLFDKYMTRSGSNAFLTKEGLDWVNEHGPIKVGYQDNYLAFCAADPKSGELTGVLKDYLDYASGCLKNAALEFEPVAYPTAAKAMEALQRHEIDCVFPANLSNYDAETMRLITTQPVIRTDVYAVVRSSDKEFFAGKSHVIVAVNEGNPNYDSFLRDHFPDWMVVYYPDTRACLKAVSSGVADCVLISNYRYNDIARICEEYKLTTHATGEAIDYCFAVNRGDTQLYSIMTKTIGLVPTSTIDAALSYYITEEAKLSIADLIRQNLALFLAIIIAIIALILGLLLRSMWAERKARKLISATEIDDLTGLYNRDFFFQYADRMREDHPETPMDAIVLNIEQFHSVNALNGRDFGDRVLRVLSNEIGAIAKEGKGIAGRFGADRFDIYCQPAEDYEAIFERLQGKLDELASNASIRLRMGVMQWQEGLEPIQLFDRARTACHMARGHYKEHLIIFDETIRQREILDQQMLNDLRRGLDEYQFEIHYQPKYDIQKEPPKLVSAEALVRWRHPQLGMINPDDFIPLFERHGRIGELDQYVWSEAARQIVRWREIYGVTIPISVNLSRVDVFDPLLETTLDEILSYNGLPHDVLKLEVTESAYTEDADQVIRVVEHLRANGYVVEMDDFGTGYSSLNMLSSMPVDVIKMDRAFIRNIEENEKDIMLVSLILDIARGLKIPVVAEGVESESQMRLLKDLGCTVVQGYYFSQPLPPSEFESVIIHEEK